MQGSPWTFDTKYIKFYWSNWVQISNEPLQFTQLWYEINNANIDLFPFHLSHNVYISVCKWFIYIWLYWLIFYTFFLMVKLVEFEWISKRYSIYFIFYCIDQISICTPLFWCLSFPKYCKNQRVRASSKVKLTFIGCSGPKRSAFYLCRAKNVGLSTTLSHVQA